MSTKKIHSIFGTNFTRWQRQIVRIWNSCTVFAVLTVGTHCFFSCISSRRIEVLKISLFLLNLKLLNWLHLSIMSTPCRDCQCVQGVQVHSLVRYFNLDIIYANSFNLNVMCTYIMNIYKVYQFIGFRITLNTYINLRHRVSCCSLYLGRGCWCCCCLD